METDIYKYSFIYNLWKSHSPVPPPLSRPFEITPPNVWPHHGDIFVPVKAGLLMHKAQGMHEFMGNHSNPQAVRALERHSLSSATSAKVGPTPGLLIIKGLSV